MRYTDLLRLAGSHERAHALARTALLPYIRDGRDHAQAREYLRSVCPSYSALQSVPRRVLKRWATRGALTGIPRAGLLKGPRLAMHRANVMTPGLRGFMP